MRGFYRKILGGEVVFAWLMADASDARRLAFSGALLTREIGEDSDAPGSVGKVAGMEFESVTGPIRGEFGDFMVRGADGTFQFVKPDIFASDYEAIPEGAAPRMHRTGGTEAAYSFRCLGCGCAHTVPTIGPRAWEFNGDTDRPTFSPSVLVTSMSPGGKRCHSFVRNGRIEYLADCSHHLAGQTVDLPPWDGRIFEDQEGA